MFMYMYIYLYLHVYIYMRVCNYIDIHVYIFVHMYICKCVYIYKYKYIYIYLYIYMYLCKYTYIHTQGGGASLCAFRTVCIYDYMYVYCVYTCAHMSMPMSLDHSAEEKERRCMSERACIDICIFCIHIYTDIYMYRSTCLSACVCIHLYMLCLYIYPYGVTTISRLLNIKGFFCTTSSLLYIPFCKIVLQF